MTELGAGAYLFRLEVSDLDASISDAPGGLYDHHTVNTLAAAAARLFRGPFFIVFEAGRGDLYAPQRGRLHAHVVAHRDDGPPGLVRGSERCKKVFDGPGLYRYLHKSDPANIEAILEYAAACVLSETGRPPRTRRPFSGAKRSAWLAAHCTALTT